MRHYPPPPAPGPPTVRPADAPSARPRGNRRCRGQGGGGGCVSVGACVCVHARRLPGGGGGLGSRGRPLPFGRAAQTHPRLSPAFDAAEVVGHGTSPAFSSTAMDDGRRCTALHFPCAARDAPLGPPIPPPPHTVRPHSDPMCTWAADGGRGRGRAAPPLCPTPGPGGGRRGGGRGGPPATPRGMRRGRGHGGTAVSRRLRSVTHRRPRRLCAAGPSSSPPPPPPSLPLGLEHQAILAPPHTRSIPDMPLSSRRETGSQ